MNSKVKTNKKHQNYRVKKSKDAPEITREEIEEAMKQFTGKIQRLEIKGEVAPINPVNVPGRLF